MIFAATDPAAEAFMSTPEGAQFARDAALSIFRDEDALTDYELGYDGVRILPAAVERELGRLIARRNAEDPA